MHDHNVFPSRSLHLVQGIRKKEYDSTSQPYVAQTMTETSRIDHCSTTYAYPSPASTSATACGIDHSPT